jgi:ribosomal protein S3
LQLTKQSVKNSVFIYYTPITTYFYDAQLLSNFIVKELYYNKKPLSVFKNILKKREDLLITSYLIPLISGIKYEIAGRIKGVDRARTIKFLWGSVSLNKLVQKISYVKNTVFTKEGTLGIKVWIAYNN